MSFERICGRLSNEASQDSEGNPVYVFLDETKSGYDAWVTPGVGDTLVIYDKDETHRIDLTVPLKERNFLKFSPPIRSYWFDKGYRAELFRKVPAVPSPPQKTEVPPPLVWGVFSPRALSLVAKERERHIVKLGGAAHDDQYDIYHWCACISRQMGRLAYIPRKFSTVKGVYQLRLKVLTKIAALALAGMESHIRKHDL